jgi:murein L,D-transpeptidase YcbB/YkuD
MDFMGVISSDANFGFQGTGQRIYMRTSAPFLSLAPCLVAALIAMASMGHALADETLPAAPPTLAQPADSAAAGDPVAYAIQKILLPVQPVSEPLEPFPPLPPVPLSRRAQLEADLHQALQDFYLQRGFQRVWQEPAQVAQLLASLDHTVLDGLNPADFHRALLAQTYAQVSQPAASAEDRARFDLLATRAALDAWLALRRGKVDPVRLDMAWNADPQVRDPRADVSVFFAAVQARQVSQAFVQAPPEDPLYLQLRQGLARLRALQKQGGWPVIPASGVQAVGDTGPAVKGLRARLVAGGYLAPRKSPSSVFDAPLASALKQFQAEQYLPANGRLDAATLAALNVPVQERIDQVRVNLERARWLLYKVQGTFVIVDIAGYKMALYRDGKAVWRSRVQVGKPVRNTPMFQSQITYITFNPTWTVPPTILVQDVLPKILRNPHYLAANHMRVLDRQGNVLDPSTVDWRNARGLTLRQDAGPKNSLGQVVIRFPNPFSIYLHDTPHRELFDQQMRATSSGCIRVEHPLQLVEQLFNDPQQWDAEAIKAKLATGKTANVHLPIKIPVLLAYWTVDLGEHGRVAFKPDVYGQDPTLLRALDRPVAAPLAGL